MTREGQNSARRGAAAAVADASTGAVDAGAVAHSADAAAAAGGGAVKRAGKGRSRRRRADGAASRERMLEAAGKLFASQGFDSVSTRALAKAARVNLSAIAYHFGDKEGLYREVVRRLIADSEPIMRPAVEHLHRAVASAAGDRARLAEVAAWFVRNLLGAVLLDERMRWQMALMLREFYEPSANFAMLLDERIHPLHDAVAALVAAASGRRAEAPETRLLAAVVIGQCMALGAARTVVCARLGWDRYTPERVAMIVRTVTPAILAMLGLCAVADGDEGAS